MTDTDAPASDQTAQGLMKAFLDLRPALVAFARARMNTHADVEDVLQDVAQRLAEREPVDPVLNKTSYLFSMVSNTIVDRARAGRSRHASGHVPIYDLELEAIQPSPEDTVAARQRLARLSELLKGLPADMRTSFELSRIKGLTLEEVAQTQGVSVHRVRKNVDTALARLSRKLWSA
jgi:RNA polymerase sigma-70 factor (ECF subfamily)